MSASSAAPRFGAKQVAAALDDCLAELARL